MRYVRVGLALLAMPGLLLAARQPRAQEVSPAAPKATLADLAWMAGRWVGGEGSDFSEETWATPEGDAMVGMWRYVAGGKTRIFEILVIRAEEAGPILRLRHFDPRLVGREDKERPVELPLVSWGPRQAVFEGPEYSAKGIVRLTYRRPTDDTLVGVLEKEGKREEFTFQRR
jgi:hypothetical protein